MPKVSTPLSSNPASPDWAKPLADELSMLNHVMARKRASIANLGRHLKRKRAELGQAERRHRQVKKQLATLVGQPR